MNCPLSKIAPHASARAHAQKVCAHDEHDIVALSWLHLKLHRLGSRVFRGRVQMLVGVFSGVQILVRIQHRFFRLQNLFNNKFKKEFIETYLFPTPFLKFFYI